ncbi:MAG: SDR family oxidoreductase [Alphaproteobacteria bacterium]|jgi:3-oxoacyl-[acyl-carrier protein] reductase|nr:SDR family oxidoreductase [Alphaproteobacteria bacterium]
MAKLADKRVVITGSSSGIGAGVAVAFAAEGADILVNYPGPEQEADAAAVCAEIEALGRRAFAIQADVSQQDEVDHLVNTGYGKLGGFDILVNNAGFAETVTADAMTVESWDQMIAVHLRSVFMMTRRILPLLYMQNWGKIINTASQLAYKGAPGYAHYTAAKAGIIGFTRSVALEVGARNVNVNCVAPGATETPLLADVDDALLDAIKASIPKGRFAEIAEIVPSYVFLASEDARYYQGQCLSPNGGDVFL